MPAYHDSGYVHRVPAWHNLSTVKQERATSWAQAREWGGITWEPEERQMFRIVAKRTDAADVMLPDGRFLTAVEGSKVIVRSDTGAELGVVGKDYTPVLHETMGELLEAFVGEGSAQYETAGAAMGGKIVYATVVLDEPFRVTGDESLTYTMAAFLNGHDGNFSTKVLPLDFRVVCANTANAASMLGDRTGLQYVFRHTASITERLEEVKGALANMRAEGLKYREVCEQLAVVKMTDGQITDAVERFVNMPAPGTSTERVRENAAQAVSGIKGYLSGPTTSDDHRKSAYGLFQAMTEYLDHGRKVKNQDTYVRRTLLTVDGGKSKALRLVTKVAGIDLALSA
jgi:phage/plasmid-like protein (TIGR03299 family)